MNRTARDQQFGVRRFTPAAETAGEMEADSDGQWVQYVSHLRVVRELKAEIERLRKLATAEIEV